MSKDFIWPEKPTPVEQSSTISFLWYVFFVFIAIVLMNAFFLPSVIAMAFPQWDLSWMFAQ